MSPRGLGTAFPTTTPPIYLFIYTYSTQSSRRRLRCAREHSRETCANDDVLLAL